LIHLVLVRVFPLIVTRTLQAPISACRVVITTDSPTRKPVTLGSALPVQAYGRISATPFETRFSVAGPTVA